MFSIKDKVIIVTGAALGIGKALATGLAQAGAKVVVADIKQAEAEQVAEHIRQQGGEALAAYVDVSQADNCQRLVEQTVNYYGRLDVMLCNAGVEVLKPLLDLRDDEWEYLMNVNLKGYFHCAQKAAQQMLKQGDGGSVIMNSSIGGVNGIAGSAAYTATKGGINLLVRSLAAEWADYGIRVNAFAPGYIDNIMEGTEGTRLPPEQDQQLLDRLIPMKRRGEPEELVGPVIFLASSAASYVTGTVCMVDGGYSAI